MKTQGLLRLRPLQVTFCLSCPSRTATGHVPWVGGTEGTVHRSRATGCGPGAEPPTVPGAGATAGCECSAQQLCSPNDAQRRPGSDCGHRADSGPGPRQHTERWAAETPGSSLCPHSIRPPTPGHSRHTPRSELPPPNPRLTGCTSTLSSPPPTPGPPLQEMQEETKPE